MLDELLVEHGVQIVKNPSDGERNQRVVLRMSNIAAKTENKTFQSLRRFFCYISAIFHKICDLESLFEHALTLAISNGSVF